MRHVCANFKNKFTGLFLKQRVWGAARATIIEYFNKEMRMLKEANILAYQWLSANAISEWSRSKCDILLNNLCESFNSTILSAREKTIVTILEQVREYLTCRMTTKQKAVSKGVHLVGPRILKIIKKNKSVARQCNVKWVGGQSFQVTTYTQDQLVVNLSEGSCSCKKFQLFGIPCGHVLTCIFSIN